MDYWELLGKSDEDFRKPLIWQMPGGSVYGKTALFNGAAQTVGQEVKKITSKKVLLIIGKHVLLKDAGAVICKSLEQSGITYDIYTEICPEPQLKDAEKIAQVMDENQYGMVIGAGGGSVMDIAKLAVHGGDGKLIERILKNDFLKPHMPLLLLPTTSGTGSEISPYIVLTIGKKKCFFYSSAFFPAIALNDPVVTATMPPFVTAATAFDAMTHGMEGCMARMSPYTECLASECTSLIFKYLPNAMKDSMDIKARYYLALASIMGMMSYVMGGGLYAHSLSYILTLEKRQPHGLGCGLALPYTLAMNEPYIHTLLDRISLSNFKEAGTKETRHKTIREIQRLFIKADLPASLGELGYTISDVHRLAEQLLTQYYREKNPREMSRTDAELLIQSMILGKIEYF